MNYAVVTTKVDPQTKKEAMRVADLLGMPLSVVIKAFLKQFIRTKSVNFSIRSETPTPQLLKDLRRSEEDVKAGRVSPTFTNVKDAIAWLDDPDARDKNGNRVHD